MRDIFHTLWRPRGIGVLSKLVVIGFRHAAAMLTLANDSLAATLDRNYLNTGGGTEQVFAAFTRDHQEDSVLDRRDDATA